MEHTHTFEIETNDIGPIEGEVSFNNGLPPHIKFDTYVEMEICELKNVASFMEFLTKLYKLCGEIKTIEIRKKV